MLGYLQAFSHKDEDLQVKWLPHHLISTLFNVVLLYTLDKYLVFHALVQCNTVVLTGLTTELHHVGVPQCVVHQLPPLLVNESKLVGLVRKTLLYLYHGVGLGVGHYIGMGYMTAIQPLGMATHKIDTACPAHF